MSESLLILFPIISQTFFLGKYQIKMLEKLNNSNNSQKLSTKKLKYGHRGANHPVKDLSSERKAINACITLYHLEDWYWKDDPMKKEKKKEVPYSLALADIANGSKHFEPNRTYLSGNIEGTDIPPILTLNKGEEVIKIEDMLKEIEKYWVI